MAKATVTEKVVRTNVVTLELTPDEARALSSLAGHVSSASGSEGPADHIENVRAELHRIIRDELPAVPRDRIFEATGDVMFSAYRTRQ
ncbi:hypothetical protein [Streptomyces sp. NPDC002952]|uniref:hypothetical protein n=1 Tax=Streptomyces sp. NPDC002952 TaxID=3364673 RepID=UPI0036CE58BB